MAVRACDNACVFCDEHRLEQRCAGPPVGRVDKVREGEQPGHHAFWIQKQTDTKGM
ncbi:hypothetical protein GCM10027343_38420 [Noviherbaspirillum agri]